MQLKRAIAWKLLVERILLLLPALIARMGQLLPGKKKQRLQLEGNSLLVFPQDPIKAFLCLPFLDWWLPALKRPTQVANLPQLLSQHPAVEKQISLPQNLLALWWFLLSKRYKTVILLEPQRYRKLSFILWAAAVKQRAGLTVVDRNPFLNFRYPFNENSIHYCHQLRAFFEDITLQKIHEVPFLEYSLSDTVTRKSLKMLSELGIGRFLLLLPSESHFPSWDIRPYAELVASQKLTVLLAALDEASFHKAQAIVNAAKRLANTNKGRNEILVTDIIELDFFAALAQRAEAVITEDTLAAYLAAAVGARVLVLFGPRNERVYAPFSNKVRMVFAPVECRPCLREQEPFFCHNLQHHACLKQITATQVQAVLDNLLDSKTNKAKLEVHMGNPQ